MQPRSISRRHAIRLLAEAGLLALAPTASALAVTQSDIDKTEAELAAAQQRCDEVEAQLEEIAEQYRELSIAAADTLGKIDDVNEEIGATEQQINTKETELEEKRTRLAKRVRSAYKSGGDEALSALLSATSFEELDSNIYYLDKISANDRELIEDVEQLKTDLEQHQADLEASKAELEELRASQVEQLGQMQEKQDEVQQILDGLDEDVQALMAKRDEEVLQLAREREEQRKREEEAKKAAEEAARKAEQDRQSQSQSQQQEGSVQPEESLSTGDRSEAESDGVTTGSQARVISACKSTPSPGVGLCAMWVSMVFQNAGYGYAGGNANDMYNWWTTSTNRAALKPGMIVAVSTHSHTTAGSIYGHIGIYIGNNTVMDNIGYVHTGSLDDWISYYSTTVPVRWGWLMGIELA